MQRLHIDPPALAIGLIIATGTVLADYGRAVAGTALTLGPLAVFNVVPVMVYILGALGALFLFFGLRTVLRHLARSEVSSEEIRVDGPAGGASAVRRQPRDGREGPVGVGGAGGGLRGAGVYSVYSIAVRAGRGGAA